MSSLSGVITRKAVIRINISSDSRAIRNIPLTTRGVQISIDGYLIRGTLLPIPVESRVMFIDSTVKAYIT